MLFIVYLFQEVTSTHFSSPPCECLLWVSSLEHLLGHGHPFLVKRDLWFGASYFIHHLIVVHVAARAAVRGAMHGREYKVTFWLRDGTTVKVSYTIPGKIHIFEWY